MMLRNKIEYDQDCSVAIECDATRIQRRVLPMETAQNGSTFSINSEVHTSEYSVLPTISMRPLLATSGSCGSLLEVPQMMQVSEPIMKKDCRSYVGGRFILPRLPDSTISSRSAVSAGPSSSIDCAFQVAPTRLPQNNFALATRNAKFFQSSYLEPFSLSHSTSMNEFVPISEPVLDNKAGLHPTMNSPLVGDALQTQQCYSSMSPMVSGHFLAQHPPALQNRLKSTSDLPDCESRGSMFQEPSFYSRNNFLPILPAVPKNQNGFYQESNEMQDKNSIQKHKATSAILHTQSSALHSLTEQENVAPVTYNLDFVRNALVTLPPETQIFTPAKGRQIFLENLENFPPQSTNLSVPQTLVASTMQMAQNPSVFKNKKLSSEVVAVPYGLTEQGTPLYTLYNLVPISLPPPKHQATFTTSETRKPIKTTNFRPIRTNRSKSSRKILNVSTSTQSMIQSEIQPHENDQEQSIGIDEFVKNAIAEDIRQSNYATDGPSKERQEFQKDSNDLPVKLIEITTRGQIVKVTETGELFEISGLHYDGYNYGVKDQQRKRFECIKDDCNVKLTVENLNIDTIKVFETHTCDGSTHETLGKRIFRELSVETASHVSAETTAESIFQDITLHYPDLSSDVDISKMKKTIQRASKESLNRTERKQKFNSVKEFGEYVKENSSFLKFCDKKGTNLSIEAELVNSSSLSYHLIFFNRELISNFNEETPIHIDSIFIDISNIKAGQFMKITSVTPNEITPISWILMSKRAEIACDAVWNFFHENFPLFKPRRLCHSHLVLGTIKSLRKHFPETIINECFEDHLQDNVVQGNYEAHDKKDEKDDFQKIVESEKNIQVEVCREKTCEVEVQKNEANESCIQKRLTTKRKSDEIEQVDVLKKLRKRN